jgi:hypothetical protein
MGWYLRKSLRLGPLRFNLSKSGIGTSVGVKGLRIGTGPKGAYLHGGRYGLYFREQLGKEADDVAVAEPLDLAEAPPPKDGLMRLIRRVLRAQR